MKNSNIFLILAILFTAFSCDLFNPDPEPPEDPKASGIYECFINGEEFRAAGPAYENQFSANPKTRHTELGGDFQFSISNRGSEQWLRVQGIIENEIGSYSLIQGIFKDQSRTECEETLEYNLLNDTINYANVTFIDTDHNIISAEFECYLVNECIDDTLHIKGHLERDYIF